MRVMSIVSAIIVTVASFVGAQSLSTDYVKGTVSIRQNGSWYDLRIGDPIPSDGTIKVGSDSFAEFSNGVVSVKLIRPGTYRLKDLVRESATNRSAGLADLLSQRIDALAGGNEGLNRSSVGGGHAGPIQQGLTLLKQGSYGEAFYRFKDAYDGADSSTAQEARFYMGYAAALEHDTFKAITYLTAYKPDPSSSYYSSQVLTLAGLYVESFAYHDALDLLGPFLASGKAAVSDAQAAYLLSGLAYQALSDAASARTALQKARDLVPGSPVAASAAELLAGM